MERREFLLQAHLDGEALDAWIEAGWLIPVRNGEARGFSELDVARACLIHDLKGLGLNDEGVPLVLDLVDQVHGLRRALRHVMARIHQQPEATRRRIAAGLRDEVSEPGAAAADRSSTLGRVESAFQDTFQPHQRRRP
jgi:chaperone modulatory protein CbpM